MYGTWGGGGKNPASGLYAAPNSRIVAYPKAFHPSHLAHEQSYAGPVCSGQVTAKQGAIVLSVLCFLHTRRVQEEGTVVGREAPNKKLSL